MEFKPYRGMIRNIILISLNRLINIAMVLVLALQNLPIAKRMKYGCCLLIINS